MLLCLFHNVLFISQNYWLMNILFQLQYKAGGPTVIWCWEKYGILLFAFFSSDIILKKMLNVTKFYFAHKYF